MNADEDRQDVLAQAVDLVDDDGSMPFVDVELDEDTPHWERSVSKKSRKASFNSDRDWVSIIKDSPFSIRQVSKRNQTDDMVLAAIIEGESEFRLPNGDVMKSSVRPLLNDKGIAKARINTHVLTELLKANPWRIPEIPEKKLNRALVRTAIENSAGHPEVLSLVPDKFKTKPICNLAVEKDPRALQYVPDDYKTRRLCKSAVERDESVIQWVPKGYIDAKTRRSAEKSLKVAREAEERAKAEAEVVETKAEEAKTELETKVEDAGTGVRKRVDEARRDVRRSNPLRRLFRSRHQS